MITMKMIILDVMVLGLIAYGVAQFLRYHERDDERKNGTE